MKIKSFISIAVAAIMLVGNCLAAEATSESTNLVASSEPISVTSLANATGEALASAKEDLIEIQAQFPSDSPFSNLVNNDTVMVYNYGTKNVDGFDVSTTLYTMETSSADSGKYVGGITVHTFSQNGFERFKIFFKMIFSVNSGIVTAEVNQATTEISGDSNASYSVTMMQPSYLNGNTICHASWKYSVQYGTYSKTNLTAYVNCSNTGVVTTGDKNYTIT